MSYKNISLGACLMALALLLPTAAQAQQERMAKEAAAMYDAVRFSFATDNPLLLEEHYPHQPKDNPYSYLWGYSAMVSGVAALYEATGDKKWLKTMDDTMLRGLRLYRDKQRKPTAYASYITRDSLCDRFYDDNIWLGIDLADLYLATGKKKYLNLAQEIWTFVMSGYDGVLGGGIYWNEQDKRSKNTCSNAPAAVFALKLYMATKSKVYLSLGLSLYSWTKEYFCDPNDHLYWDNINLKWHVNKTKFSYNAGQMIQAGVLLWKFTGKAEYLDDAQKTAASCYQFFFTAREGQRVLDGGELWFDAVMLRGLIELYQADGNATYVDACRNTAQQVADAMARNTAFRHLVNKHYEPYLNGKTTSLLNQAAMMEIFARLASVK